MQMDNSMKYNLTENELTKLAFGYPKLSNEQKKACEKKKKRRKLLAKTDKTYLNYPYVSVQTGEIVDYSFKGYSKEEIKEAIKAYNKVFE